MRGSGQLGWRLPVPYWLAICVVRLAFATVFRRATKVPSILIPRRFESRLKPLHFDNRKLREMLSWTPPLDYQQCLVRTYGRTVSTTESGVGTPAPSNLKRCFNLRNRFSTSSLLISGRAKGPPTTFHKPQRLAAPFEVGDNEAAVGSHAGAWMRQPACATGSNHVPVRAAGEKLRTVGWCIAYFSRHDAHSVSFALMAMPDDVTAVQRFEQSARPTRLGVSF